MIRIVGTGSYVPEKVLTNFDLERMVDTSDAWIVERTGIRERRIAAEEEACSDLAIKAAEKAFGDAGLGVRDIDLIIVGTVTPDMQFPATACLIQDRMGIKNAAAFDINAACSGFIYALCVAWQYLENGTYRTALVIGSEVLSRITDWQDRNTCVMLGDGAGAAILRKEEGESGILSFYMNSDGAFSDLLLMPGGGTKIPPTKETVMQKLHYLKMRGNEVFKESIPKMYEAVYEGLKKCGLGPGDVSLFIPHQANLRIINALARRLKVDEKKMFVNIEKYGNTSAATIPIALDEAVHSAKIKKGDIIELVGFGAGFTWGSCVIKW